MALLDAAASLGAEPRGEEPDESFAHASQTPAAADALYRAMVPCARRSGRLPPSMAPSHVRRSESSLCEMLAKAARTRIAARRPSVIRTVVDWDQIVPSYLAARRLAGPSSRGWAKAWCQREHPHLLGDRTRVENFLRQVRRRLPTSKEYKAPSHETGTARLTPHGRNDNGTCFPTTKRSRRTRQWGRWRPRPHAL